MGVPGAEAGVVKVTNGVAVGGLTLPAWLPALDAASNVAALLVPILSAVWLAVQIWRFVSQWRRAGG